MPRNRFALLLAALLIALAGSTASAQVRNLIPRLFKSGETTRTAFADLVAEASQSVVQVLGDGKVIALGVVAESDGFILTKASELGGKLECKTKDGKSFAATIIGVQNTHDIAMLKIDAKGLKPVKWASNTKPEVGSWLATVGVGKEPVAVGVVSTPRRVIPKQPGALGISKLPKDQTDDPNPNSEARIGQVYPNSAASEAGLKEGDVITHVDGKSVATFDALRAIVLEHAPGDVLKLRVKRGDQAFEVNVELSPMTVLPMDPNNRGAVQNRMGGKLSARRYGFPQVIQHDTVLKPEDCGGPIVTIDGAVVGLNIARAGRVESYALPADLIKPLIDDLKSGKLPPPKDIAKITPLETKKDDKAEVKDDEKKDVEKKDEKPEEKKDEKKDPASQPAEEKK